MKHEASPTFIQQIKELTPFLIQVGTVFTLLLGAYLAYNLRPLHEDIRSLRGEVKAIQDSREASQQYIPRYLQTEQKVNDQHEVIKEMKESQIRTEQKVDRILERL